MSIVLSKRNVLYFIAIIVLIWMAITCMLYWTIDGQTGQFIQHQSFHVGTNDTIEANNCNFSATLIKSALQRAKTEDCRQSLKDTFCFHIDQEVELDHTCPDFDKDDYHKFIGCFNASIPLLSGYQYKFEGTNAPDYCLQYCFRAGYELAGLHAGKNCLCGGRKDLLGRETAQSHNCEGLSCPGDVNSTCGGYSFVSVYSTGLMELKREMPKFTPDNAEEAPNIKILFVLQLNGRNSRQVMRMLRAVYSQKHLYVIHVDERQAFMHAEMKKLQDQLSKKKLVNLKVVDNRFRTIWGGSSLLDMFLDIVRNTLKDASFADWDYVLNLSESDMPLLSLEELEFNLFVNNGKSFLSSHGKNAADFIQSQGLYKAFHQCEDRMWRIKDREKFPRFMKIDGGSDWVIVHKSLAKKAVGDSLLTQQLLQFFSTVLLPLESFFHTLALNSELCHQIISKNLRLTNWNRKQGCRCGTLKNVVDWCGCSPLVFRAVDSRLAVDVVQSKAQFFARKFDSVVAVEPIQAAEENAFRFKKEILEKTKNKAFSSTWINSFDRIIDFEHPKRYLYDGIAKVLFTHWLNGQEFESCGFDKLSQIWAFKENSKTKMLPILEIVDGCGSHFQLLLSRQNKTQIVADPSLEEFEILDAEFGTGLDLKEEFFRDVLPVVDVNSKVTVLFHWKRNDSFAASKETSPLVNIQWWNTVGRLVKHELVKPYDSIYGGQFAELDMHALTVDTFTVPGMWSVQLPSKDGEKAVFETQFPVFPSDRDSKLFEKLVISFYHLQDVCSVERVSPKIGRCSESLWSSNYPDPKSQLFI